MSERETYFTLFSKIAIIITYFIIYLLLTSSDNIYGLIMPYLEKFIVPKDVLMLQGNGAGSLTAGTNYIL